MIENLRSLREAYRELGDQLSNPASLNDRENYRMLTREHSRVGKQLKVAERWFHYHEQEANNRALLKSEKDPEVLELIREDLAALEPKLEEAAAAFEEILLPHDPNDDRDAILEVRAGTGGDEAALFAEELARMYLRYAERQGWKTELIDATEGTQGGYKEVIYGVKGEGAFGMLRWESGVHRVQRVPATEAQGRIHTSAVTVAVLPEAEEVDVQINESELRIDVFRASGPGGQSVNTTDSAVRVTHLPTGLVVQCQDEKSQHKNKAKALQVLRSRLLEHAIAEQDAKIAAERKSQVGTGDRSAKIRTYNFPQSRVTDHRIGLTVHNLDAVMAGELDDVVDAIQAYRREEALAATRGK
ncbi:MAG: peptide chain release factor 1 [Krumholzibacteria bacterium]|nr:peptide chain release factor 1 [Candidatus Krumholzibacteria bacterium]